MDYLIPTALEVPDWETGFTVTPSPHHPIGAKGIGESATVGSPPGNREPFVRATVVRAQHPTSAQAGDTGLLLADGTLEGFVGGACVQASVREYGLKSLASHEPLLLRVVAGEPSYVREGEPCRCPTRASAAGPSRSSSSRPCRHPGYWSSE
nr:XdhC family protein [Cryobacterium sp. TMT2-15-1]